MTLEQTIASQIPWVQTLSPIERVECAAWSWQDAASDGTERLEHGDVMPAEVVWLRVRIGAETTRLGIPNVPVFPTLHRLFTQRNDVPAELLTAVLEYDVAPLFACLGRVFGVEIVVEQVIEPEGLAEGVLWCGRWVTPRFADPLAFILYLTPHLAQHLASVGTFDLTHPIMREATLRAEVVLAQFTLSADECDHLAVGDALLLPEWETSSQEPTAFLVIQDLWGVAILRQSDGTWKVQGSLTTLLPMASERCCVKVGQPFAVTVADVVAWHQGKGRGTTFTVPAALELTLVQGKKEVARGRLESLCGQAVLAVEGVSLGGQ